MTKKRGREKVWILTDSDRHGPPCGVALVKYDFAKKVNLSPVKMRKTDFPEVPAVCQRPGLVVFSGHERWDFPKACDQMSEAVGKEGRWGAMVAPRPPPGASAPVTPYWLGDRHFSRMLPQMDRLLTWGKRDAKSRGENRRRRGCRMRCRIERFWWDHLTPLSA